LSGAKLRLRRRGGGVVTSAGLFGLGLPELVVIGGVVTVLFGPSKLPELGKSLGKTAKSFQTAAKARQEGSWRLELRLLSLHVLRVLRCVALCRRSVGCTCDHDFR
jgi:sec-independent protein translocase protein TatA